MSHLSPERLAALVDEAPTPEERAHLATCASCSREPAAHRALVALAATERASVGLPLTRWESLAPALRGDAAAQALASEMPVRHRSRHGRAWLQAAAALLFVTGGAAIGRYSAGAAPIPGVTPGPVATTAQRADSLPATFQSVDEARATLSRAVAVYQNAAAYLAAHDTTHGGAESPSAMRTRLAALDRVSNTMRQAMNDAPYDPVINSYYLTTLGQREATLRQINTTLPTGVRLNSF